MKSIRHSLLLWLLSGIVVTGVVGAAIIYRNTLGEADEFFDYQLRQAALLLRDQSFEAAVPPAIVAEANEYDFIVQVWSATGVLVYQSQPHAVLPGLTVLGFSTAGAGEETWRTFGLISRGYVIQVGQPMRARRDQAARLAFRTLLPFAILVPVLALTVLIVVPKTLRPMRKLAMNLAARPATARDAIDESQLPEEMQPLVKAFNDLLGRLNDALAREQGFIADAAHELRTPLTALRLQLDAVQAARNADERGAAEQKLAEGIARSTRLVEQLLSLARLNPQSQAIAQRIQLDELLREVVAEKIILADARRVDLGITKADACALDGDASSMRALIGNLIDNAIRYTPESGRVDASLEKQPTGCILQVVDTGAGIPPQERTRVFERFYRSETSIAHGSGLGLSIVKSAAEQHGATIELNDGPNGRGLAVTVKFPLSRLSS